jgi:hypothetical protein
MKITIDIPDELLQHYNYNNITREILEDAFLKNHDADLHYDEVDLDSDRKTLQQLRNKHDHSLL